jgi:hypothetical protein
MKTTITRWANTANYTAQSEIVQRALATDDHSLDDLFKRMRSTQQHAVYLSGTRLDSTYCFGSLDVGMLFSVLPEDEHARDPGYHPGSTEVYVTFQGSLIMECLENGEVVDKTVSPKAVLVLPAGLCHRVRYHADRQATSLVVKTNLRYEPDVLRCNDKDGKHQCTIYSDVAACPLHQRWLSETPPGDGDARR